MKKMMALFVFGLLVLTAIGPLFAQEAAKENHFLSPILSELKAALQVGIIALIGMATTWIAAQLKARGVDASRIEAFADGKKASVAARAVAAVEAQVLKKLLPKGSKLSSATAKIMARLPGVDRDEAEELVEEALVPLGQGIGKILGAMVHSPAPVA